MKVLKLLMVLAALALAVPGWALAQGVDAARVPTQTVIPPQALVLPQGQELSEEELEGVEGGTPIPAEIFWGTVFGAGLGTRAAVDACDDCSRAGKWASAITGALAGAVAGAATTAHSTAVNGALAGGAAGRFVGPGVARAIEAGGAALIDWVGNQIGKTSRRY